MKHFNYHNTYCSTSQSELWRNLKSKWREEESINPRQCRTKLLRLREGRGGGWLMDPPPLAVSLLVELEFRGKDKRVDRDEKNTKVPHFRLFFITCPATSPKPQKLPENATSLLVELDSGASWWTRACSSWSEEHNDTPIFCLGPEGQRYPRRRPLGYGAYAIRYPYMAPILIAHDIACMSPQHRITFVHNNNVMATEWCDDWHCCF